MYNGIGLIIEAVIGIIGAVIEVGIEEGGIAGLFPGIEAGVGIGI